MFCKINNKYYVKVSNFYQEVKVENDNIVPIQGEKHRLYSPVSGCIKVSVEEILDSNKENLEKIFQDKKKQTKKIF